MSAPASAPVPAPAAPAVVTTSYWAVVRQQLGKNRTAMLALRALMALLVTALCAPLLAMNVPILWGEGMPRSPLVERLFDRSLFPSAVDLGFNLALVVLPVWMLGPRALRRDGRVSTWVARVFVVLWGVVLLRSGLEGRAALWTALGAAVVGLGVRCLPLAPWPRRLALVATWGVAFAAVLGPARDEWPVRNWVGDARATGTLALFPPVPFHPDNVADSESLARGDAAGSRRRDPVGYDLNGRSVVARLLFGTRISLTIGLVAVSIYVLIGVVLGSLAGYYGGKVDLVLMRMVEVMICFPTFFLILTIIAVFESRSIFLIMLAIGVVGWPGVARLVRGEFIRQRNLDYVTAARALGIPQRRIIFRHVLPNCLGPVLVTATFGIAGAILAESGIAFLGLGDVSASSWGQMLTTGRTSQEWHLILAPGFAIFFVVTVFNLLGEGLRDALDPKLRR